MTVAAPVVMLSDVSACSPELVGAKAAHLAIAAASGFPTVSGFVITTAAARIGIDDPQVRDAIHDAYDALIRRLAGEEAPALVVRSSSTIEDAENSSMAGRFVSVLDVREWDAFMAAVGEVVHSAAALAGSGSAPAPIAVLVQRQLEVSLGGVVFGADPVTGDRDRVVVEVVGTRPDVLVGGTALADHYVLTRRGRIVQTTRTGSVRRLNLPLRRRLARLTARAERVFGGPQDIEWCVDRDGRFWMLQTRAVTALPSADDRAHGVLLGPGPLAETLPAALRPLEVDLWIEPLRDGVRRALLTTGAASARVLDRSPVVMTVGGWAVCDLRLFGLAERRGLSGRLLNPAHLLRHVLTAWRVGRLRVALPHLAATVIDTVDRDLAEIPRLDELSMAALADVLDRGRRELATVHAHEVIAGMLLRAPERSSAAALALQALSDARAAGWADSDVVGRAPVVLALSPPSLAPAALPDAIVPPAGARSSVRELGSREGLRLRVRWLQELLGRVAMEIARRLQLDGALPSGARIEELRIHELTAMAVGGPPPSDLVGRRAELDAAPPPAAFRLAPSGAVRPAGQTSPRRHSSRPPAGLPAGGGRAAGIARHAAGEVRQGEATVLVTRHLEPQLAPLLGDLVGLVSETGSALSHLAILARETGVAAVVGVPDAQRRFPAGSHVLVDGSTGEVKRLDELHGLARDDGLDIPARVLP